ncbi:Post-segregation antitoxin CcdA [uncultured archaeon]|nr:Post-segregation antitoxin CcdA [uncultured archaeon]
MTEKQKLTLSVEKELVEKAKKLGVNISEITETVLRHISETETKEVVTKEEVTVAYKKMFDAMLPAMKKFGSVVKVGVVMEANRDIEGRFYIDPIGDVFLLKDSELWNQDAGATPKFEEVSFYPPKEILSNYIDSLIEASEKNKEGLKELEIFRRVIEALTETTIPEYRKEKKLEA